MKAQVRTYTLCANCRGHWFDEHTRTGKCLYAPATFKAVPCPECRHPLERSVWADYATDGVPGTYCPRCGKHRRP